MGCSNSPVVMPEFNALSSWEFMKRLYNARAIVCLALSLIAPSVLWEWGYLHSMALGCVQLTIGGKGSGLMVNCLALRARIEELEKHLEERR